MALEDAGSFIFGGNTGLSYEQLKQRRAIAQALASRQGGFPKNKGEGLTYLGQSIGEALGDIGLQRREAEYRKAQSAALGTLRAPGTPPAAPPATPPPATPPPATPPPAKTSDAGDGDTLAPVVAASTMDTSEAPTTSVAGFSDTAPVAPWPTTVAATSEQPSFSDRFAAATPPPVQDTPPASVRDRIAALVQPVSQDPNAPAPLTGGNNAVNADTMALPQLASMQANVKQAGPVPAPDVALPRGDPRTTSGVRATMEAALSRGGQSPAAISGIERNVRDESSFDPNLRHPDQPGFSGEARYAHGLYQEGGDEWNNYVNWIDKNAPGSDWRDPNLQSKFLAERLQDPQYARANAEMNRPDTSPSGAAISFLQGYLKPAPQYMAQRTEQYARENNDPAYANKQIAQGGDTGSATVGGRAGPGGREGGAPPEDARDLVTQALLSQSQQKPQDQADSGDYLPDVVGMTNRTTLPQRPTAALGRAGVQGDVSLPTLQPMGALTGAPTPAAGTPPGLPPGSPQGGDPRDAIAAAVAAQQSPDVPLADPTGAGAVAPIAAQGPQPTMTDIQPAPIGGPGQQVAAGPQPPPIPGPLEAPVPRPVPPVQAQPETPKQFAQPPVAPTPPPIPPISQAELRAQQIMSQFPDDPVIQQRAQQALADAEKQRLLPYQRDIEKYKSDLGLYNEQYKEWQTRQANQPKEDLAMRAQQQELADKQAAAARSTRLGGIPESVYAEQIKESSQTVKGLAGATQAIANARSALDDKMFTGSLAERELQIRKFLTSVGYAPEDPRIAPTEAFKAYMASVTAQARSALVGNAQISNADLAAAKEASGGKITLEASSIRKVLDSLERINTASAIAHQGKLLAYAGDDPNAQRSVFGVFGLPMERVVPPAFIDRLRAKPELAGEFDKTFNTPGLAARILQQR